MTSSDSSSRSASSASTVKFSSCLRAARARSSTSGTSSSSTAARFRAVYFGCSADSLTEIPGRSGSTAFFFAPRPIASIASA